jgi:2-polyprenyl-6-methoxyphenol hydroxylase-like FAD-dependent oxidoreductase
MIDQPADPTVLVVGAGPVGLLMGCELALRRVPFRIIDKLPAPTTESRAIVVHARSLEMLARVGVLEQIIASGVKTTRVQMHAGGRVIADVSVDAVDSPFPFSIMTAQTETERILTERLNALGTAVERGVELMAFDQDDDGVRATIRLPDGTERRVSSRWIVGADGAHSTVRQQTGTHLEGSFKGEWFAMGDVEADDDLARGTMHIHFADAGPLMAFPMLGQRMRVIAQIPGDSRVQAARPTLGELQALIDERAPGIQLREAHWLTYFEIHHGQVPNYRIGCAFLTGDAAHVHSPAGGQGMNTGMQDAFNLGWKLALAAEGRARDALLDSYQSERHPVAKQVISRSTRLTKLATVEGDVARRLRNLALHLATGLGPVRDALAEQTEETDVNYRDSQIVAGGHRSGGPRPGDAAPHVEGTDLAAALAAASEHAVVCVAPAGAPPSVPSSHPADATVLVVADARTREAGDAIVLTDPDRRIAERYGFGAAGGTIVVRPDGYIGLLAEAGDDAAVVAYFANTTGATDWN